MTKNPIPRYSFPSESECQDIMTDDLLERLSKLDISSDEASSFFKVLSSLKCRENIEKISGKIRSYFDAFDVEDANFQVDSKKRNKASKEEVFDAEGVLLNRKTQQEMMLLNPQIAERDFYKFLVEIKSIILSDLFDSVSKKYEETSFSDLKDLKQRYHDLIQVGQDRLSGEISFKREFSYKNYAENYLNISSLNRFDDWIESVIGTTDKSEQNLPYFKARYLKFKNFFYDQMIALLIEQENLK